MDSIGLERITLRTKVRIDRQWSLNTEGKGRAFPDGFLATVAESEMEFTLLNPSRQTLRVPVLLPFDASDMPGTGFVQPLSVAFTLEGRHQETLPGPEIARGMARVRSYRLIVAIQRESSAKLKIKASHPLAMNPAWYRFVCADASLNIPGYRNLAQRGCRLDFEFEPADSDLQGLNLKLGWKKATEAHQVREGRGLIQLSEPAVEYVTVNRVP